MEKLVPTGEPFDPNLHEAVAHEPGEGGPPVVTDVFRSGYVWKGRVIRPAMVKVRD
jgi:molecular chaperone GrpE